MDRLWLVLGAAFALTGVAAGAFAAHGLRDLLDAEVLPVFETAVRFQMYHALALVALAAVAPHLPGSQWTGWLFVAGILVFSGSLYLLALTGARFLGAVTPIGGLCFLAGWGLLLYHSIASR